MEKGVKDTGKCILVNVSSSGAYLFLEVGDILQGVKHIILVDSHISLTCLPMADKYIFLNTQFGFQTIDFLLQPPRPSESHFALVLTCLSLPSAGTYRSWWSIGV